MKNIKLKNKLLVLVAIPLTAFLIMLALSEISNYQKLTEAKDIRSQVDLAIKSSSLVHELQKERGMSAGFLSSAGVQFSNQLRQQRQQADGAAAAWRQYVGEDHNFDQSSLQSIEQVREQLTKLAAIRQRVGNQSIALGEAVGFYTGLINKLLAKVSSLSFYGHNAEVSREAVALYAFLQAKENAGIERAVLSTVFANDRFNDQNYRKFINLTSLQKAFTTIYLGAAGEAHQQFYHQQLSIDAVKQVEHFRAQALAAYDKPSIGISAEAWFAQASARINALKKVEDLVSQDLVKLADQMHDSALSALVWGVLTIVVIG
ncbi:MAG: nitrate- and nitrite sensing domain-containing protein, partial [Cellvibrionaceae bacterium]|nr:nitrate- and nitrite sensing domain-containing protein [Cellvibrionaceae bacterium]